MRKRDQFDADFKRVGRFIAAVQIFIFVVVALMFVAFGMIAWKLATLDISAGLKPLVEEAWCGEPGCTERHR